MVIYYLVFIIFKILITILSTFLIFINFKFLAKLVSFLLKPLKCFCLFFFLLLLLHLFLMLQYLVWPFISTFESLLTRMNHLGPNWWPCHHLLLLLFSIRAARLMNRYLFNYVYPLMRDFRDLRWIIEHQYFDLLAFL